jgi:hypothetical protein
MAIATRALEMRLLGQVEELVGGITHCGHDDDHVVARLLGLDDSFSNASDTFGGSHRRSTVLLDDESHACVPPLLGCVSIGVTCRSYLTEVQPLLALVVRQQRP